MDPIKIKWKDKEYILTPRILMLDDAAELMRVCEGMELGDNHIEFMKNLSETGFYDAFMALATDGKKPSASAGQWMPLKEGLEVIDRFFELNSDGIARLDDSFVPLVQLVGGTLSKNSTPDNQEQPDQSDSKATSSTK